MEFKKIFSFYRGNFSRNFMKTRLLLVIFGVFGGLLLIALFLYPSPYNLITDAVSNLGNPKLNPSGWFFFSFAFWFLAFMFPFIFMYLHKRLLHLYGTITKIGTLFNITFCYWNAFTRYISQSRGTLFLSRLSCFLNFCGACSWQYLLLDCNDKGSMVESR